TPRSFICGLCLVIVMAGSCSLGKRTTTVRGYVHSGEQKVGGGDIRLSSKELEATAPIGTDGHFRVTLEHPSGARLELKVLQPGFEHDKIEFNSIDAPQGEMDINLKRLFTPAPKGR
ncbi:MAG: hypothetical protein ACJ72Z_04430, partial [Pyrinomonadaceae bacterium]